MIDDLCQFLDEDSNDIESSREPNADEQFNEVSTDNDPDEQANINIEYVLQLIRNQGEVDDDRPSTLVLSKSIKDQISKIREISNVFRKSCNNALLLKSTANIKLTLDCKTRWSSLFKMIKSFLDNYKEIRKCLLDIDKEDLLTTIDKGKLEQLREALKLFDESRLDFSREDCNFENYLDRLAYLESELERLSATSEIHFKLHQALRNRREHNLKRCIHERIYNVLTDVEYQDANLDELIETIEEKVNFFKLNDIIETSEVNQSNVQVEQVDLACENDNSFQAFLRKKKQGKSNNTDLNPKERIKKEILDFKRGGTLTPDLILLLTMIKQIIPTSVIVERLFSHMTFLLTKIRNRLAAVTLNNILIVRTFFNVKSQFY